MASKAFALFLAVNLVVLGVASACAPMDALRLGVCANVVGLIEAEVGVPPTKPCCSLVNGLGDLEAAVCLCTAIKGSVLGINLNLPIDLSLIFNNCGRTVPTGFFICRA